MYRYSAAHIRKVLNNQRRPKGHAALTPHPPSCCFLQLLAAEHICCSSCC